MENETTEAATQSVSDLPEWAQALIKETRAEAARYRTENRALTARVEEVESERDSVATERDDLKAAADAHGAELEGERFARRRDQLAFERGLPLDVASLVNETDDEALTKALDALAALKGDAQVVKPAPNPAQEAEPVEDEQAQKEAFARQIFKID